MTGPTPVLDTGQLAYWTTGQRRELARCQRCEWHPATQGHHDDCPNHERNTP